MANIATIREHLAASLSTIQGWQCSPYILSQPTPPGMHIVTGEVEYLGSMQGDNGPAIWREFTVQAFVNLNQDIESQKSLDLLSEETGDMSVRGAIIADQTLGGTVSQVVVLGESGARLVDPTASGQLLVNEFRLRVFI